MICGYCQRDIADYSNFCYFCGARQHGSPAGAPRASKRLMRSAVDCKIAGEVKGFNPEEYMDRKTARHIGRYCQFALAASKQALAQSGLEPGEMNPDELWDTTMNPESRLLLQVTLEDAAQADEMFSILMGEDVEQRRSFIQRNAKDVRFLDI